jgi:hypothetical protein
MILTGSCHCRAVRFTVESHEPVPFMRCYCSICRKTAGTGGFAINIAADYGTLEVKGKKHLAVYRAKMWEDGNAAASQGRADKPKRSTGQRNFCSKCGTALWMWDPRWPELVHPHAGAIDTELPQPPENVHIMLTSKAGWVEVCATGTDKQVDEFPEESLAQWHERHGLTD